VKSQLDAVRIIFFEFGKAQQSDLGRQRAMLPSDVNLYLVGFMGTGKTTIGRIVSHRLGFTLLDSDHEIERIQRRSIPQIFEEDGEPAFRKMEHDFVFGGHAVSRAVVACGGGLVVQPSMAEALRERGVVVCLHASMETVMRRTQGNRNRPLLDVADPMERIRTLYAEREPIYSKAGTVILTDGRPMLDIMQHVLRAYRREAEEFARESNRKQAHGG
jgi:shikimate kinase